MSWSAGPSLAGFDQFIANAMQIAPQYLPVSLPAPATPALAAQTTGGTLTSGTYYVLLTYVSLYGETVASPQAPVTVTGPTGQITVTSPALVPGTTGYNVYSSTASNGEVLQNATPIAIGTAYVIMTEATGTAPPPSANAAGSPFPGYAYNRALALVIQISCIPTAEYTGAVYNCAGAILVAITPDQPRRTFFYDQRCEYGLLKFAAGVVSSTADQGTSTTLAVPDGLAQMTIGDLQFVRTPWGREYLAYAQDYGPTVWGLS